jgi:hypothetical protein
MATWYQKQQDKLKYEDLDQQEKEARQALEQAKAAYWNDVGNLKRGTWNNALERNIVRSTIPQADIDRGMVPLDQGLTFANQNLENTLSSIGRDRRAYDLYVKHRDYRPPKPPSLPDAKDYFLDFLPGGPASHVMSDYDRTNRYNSEVKKYNNAIDAYNKFYGTKIPRYYGYK